VVGAGGTVAAGIAAGIGVGGADLGSAGPTITVTGIHISIVPTIAHTTMATIRLIPGRTTPPRLRTIRLSPPLSDLARGWR
jgi:hypothetical protein